MCTVSTHMLYHISIILSYLCYPHVLTSHAYICDRPIGPHITLGSISLTGETYAHYFPPTGHGILLAGTFLTAAAEAQAGISAD
jgi:hypothetical protein